MQGGVDGQSRATLHFVILRPAFFAGRRTSALAGSTAPTAECIGPSARKRRGPQDDKV